MYWLCASGLLLVAVAALLPGKTYALDSSSTFFTRHLSQRQLYMELGQLLEEGNLEAVARRQEEIQGYPLGSYLEYRILRKRLANADQPIQAIKQVDAYDRKYNDERFYRRLIGVLKNRAVKLNRWKDYAVIAKLPNAPVHPCDDLLSRVKNGQTTSFDESARQLWVEPGRHTGNCDTAYSALIKQNAGIPAGTIWRRTVSLIVNGQLDRARLMLRFFNRRDQQTVRAWIEGVNEPQTLIKSDAVLGTSEHHRRIVSHLLQRWQRVDIEAASDYWRLNGVQFGFSADNVAATINRFAVLAAKRRLPVAPSLLEKASGDRDVRYWRVRMALRSRDWQGALQQLDRLSGSENQSVRWRYWRARSLSELGYRAAAEKIYRQLAGKFEYYGFLAADQLAMTYNIGASAPLVDRSALNALKTSGQLERAIEFFLTGTGWEGRREWNRALQGASREQLVAAAQIALSLDWHDRAFASMKLAGEKNALELLFPTPHRDLVNTLARQLSVPREFVYGVMRQESSFIPDIKSPAGAVGLMQLMPATAREMGSKIGLRVPRWKLTDGELNIRLGVMYLNQVLGQFRKNTVLAAAAYNAGPRRVSQWHDEGTIAADIWVETIPFDETRHYVKSVLFNTTVLDWRLRDGAHTRLRVRMPDILPLG